MLRSISGTQFREWRAYAELEPFDEVRADIRTAHLVQTVRNVLGDKATLTDCLLPFGEDEAQKEAPAPPKIRDWREIKAIGQQWVDALNARKPAGEPEAAHP